MSGRRILGLWWLLAAAVSAESDPVPSRGHLVIIGGGRQPPAALRRFVELAGGPQKARLLIIPMASEDPAASGESQLREFVTLGVTNAGSLVLTHDPVALEAAAARLEEATAVFFTGGDQARLASYVVGTPMQPRLLALYARGGVVAGTSAGAAIMSEVMITGEERPGPDGVEKFSRVRRDLVVTVRGLGFVTNAVIDQHFLARKRHNRLLSVVLEHPQLLGIGIDEDTAIVVDPDGTFEVVGERSVLVLDARQCPPVKDDPHGNLGLRGLRVDVLLNGDRFDPASETRPPKP